MWTNFEINANLFSKKTIFLSFENKLSVQSHSSQILFQSQINMNKWKQQISDLFSNLSAAKFKSWTKKTKINLTKAEFWSIEYQYFRNWLKIQNNARIKNWKSINVNDFEIEVSEV